jgi:hypothetical protein
MATKKGDRVPPARREDDPAAKDAPNADTATDRDEWMEKHGGRPEPVPGDDAVRTTPSRPSREKSR